MTTQYDGSYLPVNNCRPAPGATVGNGRYRLLAWHGARQHLQFWQGVDLATGSDVGLTLVDPERALPEEFVHEILARTVRLKGVDAAGLARVCEVLYTGRLGVVVAEWVHGGSLPEIAATAPSPNGVASAMQSLAAAAEEAHRAGLMLSIDDPARVRIGVDGHAALAFPATMPDATVASDLRGIGDAMCALLNSDSTMPFLTSTITSGLQQETGGIASAATLLTLLQAATGNEAGDGRVMPPLPPPPPGQYAAFRDFGPDERATAARRQLLRIGMVTTAVIAVLALVGLGSTLNNIFNTDRGPARLDTDKLGLTAPTTSAVPQPPQVANKGAKSGERVQPVAAAVFSPGGSPDSPETAGAAIDGNPATAWSTDTYYDGDPFPKFKPGVGLLLRLARPTMISAVTVDLNSSGTVVQVRSAASDNPATLADTTELSAPTPTQPGHNRIPVTASRPVPDILVWISTLGSSDGKSRSAISQIELQAASPPA